MNHSATPSSNTQPIISYQSTKSTENDEQDSKNELPTSEATMKERPNKLKISPTVIKTKW